MALSAAASFSFPALAPLLTLLSVFAFASAPLLLGARTPAPTPPFLLALVIVSICMRGLVLILSKVDRRTS